MTDIYLCVCVVVLGLLCVAALPVCPADNITIGNMLVAGCK